MSFPSEQSDREPIRWEVRSDIGWWAIWGQRGARVASSVDLVGNLFAIKLNISHYAIYPGPLQSNVGNSFCLARSRWRGTQVTGVAPVRFMGRGHIGAPPGLHCWGPCMASWVVLGGLSGMFRFLGVMWKDHGAKFDAKGHRKESRSNSRHGTCRWRKYDKFLVPGIDSGSSGDFFLGGYRDAIWLEHSNCRWSIYWMTFSICDANNSFSLLWRMNVAEAQ